MNKYPGVVFVSAVAIIRVDRRPAPGALPEDEISVVRILWDLGEAAEEVRRLNDSDTKGYRYYWQATHADVAEGGKHAQEDTAES